MWVSDIVEVPQKNPVNIIIHMEILEPVNKELSFLMLTGSIYISEYPLIFIMLGSELQCDDIIVPVDNLTPKDLIIVLAILMMLVVSLSE